MQTFCTNYRKPKMVSVTIFIHKYLLFFKLISMKKTWSGICLYHIKYIFQKKIVIMIHVDHIMLCYCKMLSKAKIQKRRTPTVTYDASSSSRGCHMFMIKYVVCLEYARTFLLVKIHYKVLHTYIRYNKKDTLPKLLF